MKKVLLTLALALATAASANAYSGQSDWAAAELEKASNLKLIPTSLAESDVSKPINRSEFAALSVKLYEALSGTAAEPASENPFTDTSDAEILKAYAAGITTGTTETTFDPQALLSREQAATMLARTYSATGSAEIKPVGTAKFADDGDISSWAKDSVYFMFENGIINGVGDNKFAPQNVTKEQEDAFYANSTREQALAISVRMYEKFKTAAPETKPDEKPETKPEEKPETKPEEKPANEAGDKLLKQIPPYDFGKVKSSQADEYSATVMLEDVTHDDYVKYCEKVKGLFPTNLYTLDANTYSMKNTNGSHIITLTLSGSGMSIVLEPEISE